MFQKFFSVVGGERKDAVVPTLGIAQSRDQIFHLLIDPSDARVVQRYHFITMPGEPLGPRSERFHQELR